MSDTVTQNPCTACDNNQANVREHLKRPYCKCENCGAFSWPTADTKEQAIEAWNGEHPL